MRDEEEINKKIKDAADQYHPAYDDNAWDKMEQMLDEHLPQKKDRRRILYFLPLILLLGGGIIFIISRNEKIFSSKISEKTVSKSNSEKTQYHQQNSSIPGEITTIPSSATTGKNNVTDVKSSNEVLDETSTNTANRSLKKNSRTSSPVIDEIENSQTKQTTQNLLPIYQNNAGNKKDNRNVSVELNAKNNTSIENSTAENSQINKQQKTTKENTTSATIAGNDKSAEKPKADIAKAAKDTLNSKDVTKVENPKDANSNIKQKKTNKSFTQNFGISVGVGPDISGVRLSKTGKITFTYGAGLSYSFTKKFTLRTGFYVAKKIYSVYEDDYHVQPGSPVNFNYLESVNANCKVYEIPLTLSYSFGKVKNHNWFASAGLSSYFMKRESYVYFYKYPSGRTDNRSWTVTNQNKHYFSVLDLSAGYEYSINKRFSILAEPYVKLPLSGIGLGKIKLNSGGILFTLTLKPFHKK